MTEQEARDFLAALGAEITSWRKRRKLTRGDLAKRVGVSETTIGRIERGGSDAAVATSDVWRISAALGLAFSDLVRRAEEAEQLSEVTDTRRLPPYSFEDPRSAARREDRERPHLDDE